ncbi:hypothetical protein IWX90DRAFT_54083 [Phyllosticta citrichinensis]|uniref:Uncharacterized protein n=1 Tax=Phyllosticta citrichinensis TaxID=1130410 RepID=A0ABR1XIW3_9PEZI
MALAVAGLQGLAGLGRLGFEGSPTPARAEARALPHTTPVSGRCPCSRPVCDRECLRDRETQHHLHLDCSRLLRRRFLCLWPRPLHFGTLASGLACPTSTALLCRPTNTPCSHLDHVPTLTHPGCLRLPSPVDKLVQTPLATDGIESTAGTGSACSGLQLQLDPVLSTVTLHIRRITPTPCCLWLPLSPLAS